jgi:hypothetical protein
MSRAPLLPAILAAVLLHLAGLLGAARFWGALDVPRLAPQPPAVEVVAVVPEPEPLTIPELIVPPLLASPPLAAADLVPVAPPPARPVRPGARPVPFTPPAAQKTPASPPASDRAPAPPAAAATPAEQALPPGPPLPPSPTAEGNAPGERSQETPPTPVEGEAAGAGNLFAQGDVPVVPGPATGGGSGGPGRTGLGFAAEGRGTPGGGIRPDDGALRAP